MTYWRSIDTAPHGVDVLLATPPFACMGSAARWDFRVGKASWGDAVGGVSNRGWDSWATHWMPLPDHPGDDTDRSRLMENEIHTDEDVCPNCGGEGYVESCFEDTCNCIDPPCQWVRCDWCNPRPRPKADIIAVSPLLALEVPS